MPNPIPTEMKFFAPIYLVQDKTVVGEVGEVPVAIVRALDDLEGRGTGLLSDVRANATSMMVEPCTEYLAYSANCDRCEDVPYWRLMSPASLAQAADRETFIREVFDYQIRLGADVLVTPTFIAEDFRSPWFQTNSLLLATAAGLMNTDDYSDYQWASSLTVGPDIYGSEVGRVAVRSSLLAFQPDFVLLKALESGDTADTALLRSHVQLVSELSDAVAPVIASVVGSFGIGLCGAGATGFASGLQMINRPTETSFRQRQTGYGASVRPRGFVYLPEILRSIDEAAADAVIGLQYTDEDGNPAEQIFSPPYQMNGWPLIGDIPKNTHFALCRLAEAQALAQAADPLETARDMFASAQFAAETVCAMQPTVAGDIDTTTILRWSNAI